MADRSRGAAATAARATALIVIAYVLVSLILNVLIAAHSTGGLDREIDETLATLQRASVSHTSAQSVIGYFGTSARIDPDEELDKAPVAYWWVPSTSGGSGAAAVPSDSALPNLPASVSTVEHPVTSHFGGRTFRVGGVGVPGGRWVVAVSIGGVSHDVRVAELAEVVVLPFLAAVFFGVAFAIGKRAIAPVEEARRKLLAFTADASHELRTPLSVIDAEVTLALSADRDVRYHRSVLEKIRRESDRLTSLVEELLWLARFDAGPRQALAQDVDLAAVAESSVHRFEAMAGERAITLDVVEESAQPVVLHIRPEWIDRLVSVLLDNACRYGAEGSRVTVRVGSHDGGAVLMVDDGGPGIPEEERDLIFRRFHRARSEGQGSGLGLAIADAIVTASGGRWKVGTSPYGGARMEVAW